MTLWADDRRVLTAVALSAFLAAQMAYMTVHVAVRPENYQAALVDPAAWDGEPVVVTLYEVVEIPDARHYVLRRTNNIVHVEGDSTGLALRMDVSVGGSYRAADAAIVEQWKEVHPMRDGKRILGLAGVALLLAFLPAWFTVRDGRVVERA